MAVPAAVEAAWAVSDSRVVVAAADAAATAAAEVGSAAAAVWVGSAAAEEALAAAAAARGPAHPLSQTLDRVRGSNRVAGGRARAELACSRTLECASIRRGANFADGGRALQLLLAHGSRDRPRARALRLPDE